MAVHRDKYRITWSTRGERAGEAPQTVIAHTYMAEGDFFTFYSQNPMYDSPILRVRASDVQEIRRVENDD
jgi:hypothetical protein